MSDRFESRADREPSPYFAADDPSSSRSRNSSMHVATSLVHTPLACETDRLGVVEDLAPAAHAHSGASAASGGETLLELHWRVFPRLLMPLLPDHLEPELDDHEGRVVITVASVPDGSSDLVLTVAADVRSVLNDLTGQHVIAQYRGPAGLAADDPGVEIGRAHV